MKNSQSSPRPVLKQSVNVTTPPVKRALRSAAAKGNASSTKDKPQSASAAGRPQTRQVATPWPEVLTPPLRPSLATPSKAASHTPPLSRTKAEIVVDLLKKKAGATLDELMAATDWQRHSVRGYLAGALKKRGLSVRRHPIEGQPARYRLAKGV